MDSKREPKSIKIREKTIQKRGPKNDREKLPTKWRPGVEGAGPFKNPATTNAPFWPNKLPKVDYLPVGNLL